MIGKAAAELRQLPVGSTRSVAFETGRLTFELAVLDQATARQIAARLLQAGFIVDGPTVSSRGGSQTAILTVRVQ
jgi:hypothetical protein